MGEERPHGLTAQELSMWQVILGSMPAPPKRSNPITEEEYIAFLKWTKDRQRRYQRFNVFRRERIAQQVAQRKPPLNVAEEYAKIMAKGNV